MKAKFTLAIGTLLLAAGLAQGDVLKLKQGGIVQGVLVTANSKEIVFMGIDRLGAFVLCQGTRPGLG